MKFFKKNNFLLFFIILGFFAQTKPIFSNSAQARKKETVVCIHGFLGAGWNMGFLKKNISKKGYEVISWQYSSKDKFIKDHAKDLVIELKEIAKKKPGAPINFVTHSMGGLVLRAAMNEPSCPNEAKIGKAVLLAPPNKGASWARVINNYKAITYFLKDFSAKELLTKENFDYLGDFPSSLKVFIIAGSCGINPFIEKPNDGTVAVSETVLKTPHEHIVLFKGHETIIFSKEVCRNVISFLERSK